MRVSQVSQPIWIAANRPKETLAYRYGPPALRNCEGQKDQDPAQVCPCRGALPIDSKFVSEQRVN